MTCASGRLFSPGTPVSSTNKTDSCDIAEVFLKVVLNTITPIITCILLMNYFLIFPCRQLLNDCGIGVSSFSGNQAAMSEGPVVGQHRVLLFCQLKSMLEIVESDLLK